ncbi:hypothetical protein PAHAL_9G351300 [Panicum hallii]|uniref:Uncharacterized protein n=1 Tax=Panicum hallii TaxID=206008 RepID=A0A2T8I3I5_9POAL|nr:hypothetical protein PAHAL_9G351300 [Panicum hallii]
MLVIFWMYDAGDFLDISLHQMVHILYLIYLVVSGCFCELTDLVLNLLVCTCCDKYHVDADSSIGC